MFNRILGQIILVVSGIILICSPNIAEARQTIVLGSIGAGYDYWDRSYSDADVEEGEGDDRRQFGLSPEIEIQSNDIHDSLTLRYAPVLTYDDLESDTDIDHYLDFTAERFFTRQWQVEFADNFVFSDDPQRYDRTFNTSGLGGQEQDSTNDEITRNLGRTRYWTNNLMLQTTYTYAEDSDAGLGYAYRILRNDSGVDDSDIGYDEYDRHEIFGLWSNRFSPAWRSQLDLSYVKGLYDEDEESEQSQDLQEYRADLQLDYTKDVSNVFPLLYGFVGSRYEDLRGDIWAHNVTIGWDHSFDSRTQFTIGAGPSYINSEDLDGVWGYNGYLNFTKTYQHFDIALLCSKDYVPQNFSGSNDAGFTDTSEIRLEATYQFTQYFNSTLYGQFRYEDILNPQDEYLDSALGDRDPSTIDNVGDVSYTREGYSAGVSMDYTFWRWFVATLNYEYYKQNGEVTGDSYNDHRIMLQLTASKELWR